MFWGEVDHRTPANEANFFQYMYIYICQRKPMEVVMKKTHLKTTYLGKIRTMIFLLVEIDFWCYRENLFLPSPMQKFSFPYLNRNSKNPVTSFKSRSDENHSPQQKSVILCNRDWFLIFFLEWIENRCLTWTFKKNLKFQTIMRFYFKKFSYSLVGSTVTDKRTWNFFLQRTPDQYQKVKEEKSVSRSRVFHLFLFLKLKWNFQLKKD